MRFAVRCIVLCAMSLSALLLPGAAAESGSQESQGCPMIQTSLHYPYVVIVPDCAPDPVDDVARIVVYAVYGCVSVDVQPYSNDLDWSTSDGVEVWVVVPGGQEFRQNLYVHVLGSSCIVPI